MLDVERRWYNRHSLWGVRTVTISNQKENEGKKVSRRPHRNRSRDESGKSSIQKEMKGLCEDNTALR